MSAPEGLATASKPSGMLWSPWLVAIGVAFLV
jgi:hypothetical protein